LKPGSVASMTRCPDCAGASGWHHGPRLRTAPPFDPGRDEGTIVLIEQGNSYVDRQGGPGGGILRAQSLHAHGDTQ
jgi:hypothetical protein